MSRPIRNTEATRPLPRQGSALAPPSKARKVLISFISTDQDSYEFKKQDPVFMGSFGQTPDQQPTNRHEIWRPTVALAQLFGLAKGYDDLIFNDYYLLWDGKEGHRALVNTLERDIKDVSPNGMQLHVVDLRIRNAFETKEVYPALFNFLRDKKFHSPDTQYYVNCTNGTTQIRNCLFYLTQVGHIEALRITPTPWQNFRARDRRCVKGSYSIDDPADIDTAYENIDDKGGDEVEKTLMRGVITKNSEKLKKIAHVVTSIKNIKKVDFQARQTILITGETGVGKSQLAQNIATALGKAEDKFISLNCATIRGADPNIQRAELFGSTGKLGNVQQSDGVLLEADNGVLFLDEIGELNAEMQAMLLTALDKGTFIPLGGGKSDERKSTFFLICGTNQPMEELVEKGAFRRDLFNRINAWHFDLDPLRDHRDDIQANLKAMVKEIGSKCGKEGFQIQQEAEQRFLELAETITWDGNFRELNAMISRMVILSDGPAITPDVVETAFDDARKLYELKRARETSQAAEAAPHVAESRPDYRDIIGEKEFESLTLLEKVEFNLLAKTIKEQGITDQCTLCRIVYGGKLTPGGLSRRLKNLFGLRFAHGRLIKTPQQTTKG